MKNALAQIKRKKRIQQLLAAAVALVLLWFSLPILSHTFFAVLTPIWSSFNLGKQVVSEDIGSQLTPRHQLIAENTKLKERVQELSAAMSSLEADKRALERDIGVSSSTPVSGTVMRGAVYAKPPVSPYGTFLVNVGWKAGLREGDYARVYDDVVLGTVERVYSYHALVSLISRPDRVTPALFESGIQVDIIGQGGGTLHTQVPVGSEVEEGHVVYATEPSRPVIGVVEAVQEKRGEGILEIFIRQSVNPHEVSHLLFDISDHER
ncbi:MAG: rod shape-determining protein MreC [Candidatus Paceibacterota bacterium]